MHLSKFTYYSFRTLVYLANNRENVFTTEELSDRLEVSRHHLKKIINKLGKTEFIISTKGRTGGIMLGLDPRDINLGELIRITEKNLNMDECFYKNNCLNSDCKIKGVMQNALNEFINEFSKYYLSDIL